MMFCGLFRGQLSAALAKNAIEQILHFKVLRPTT
jgi:hypothetical protein